jgi:deoxycytidylate deaminase
LFVTQIPCIECTVRLIRNKVNRVYYLGSKKGHVAKSAPVFAARGTDCIRLPEACDFGTTAQKRLNALFNCLRQELFLEGDSENAITAVNSSPKSSIDAVKHGSCNVFKLPSTLSMSSDEEHCENSNASQAVTSGQQKLQSNQKRPINRHAMFMLMACAAALRAGTVKFKSRLPSGCTFAKPPGEQSGLLHHVFLGVGWIALPYSLERMIVADIHSGQCTKETIHTVVGHAVANAIDTLESEDRLAIPGQCHVYVTQFPCVQCSLRLVAKRVAKLYFLGVVKTLLSDYHCALGILNDGGVEVVRFDDASGFMNRIPGKFSDFVANVNISHHQEDGNGSLCGVGCKCDAAVSFRGNASAGAAVSVGVSIE